MNNSAAFRFDDKMNFDFHAPRRTRVELDASLTEMERAQLIRVLLEGEPAYLFKHALVQDSTYATLLKHERKRLHRLVGETLERVYAEGLDEVAARLAQHFAAAGDDEKASAYEIRAGDASARVLAFPEARSHYQLALKLLPTLGDSVQLKRARIDTTMKYVAIAYTSDPPFRLLAMLKEAEGIINALPSPLELEDRTRRAHLHQSLSSRYVMLNDYATAFTYLEPLLKEAHELGDEELYANVRGSLGGNYPERGRLTEAVPLLASHLAYLAKKNRWREWGQAAGVLAMAQARLGQVQEGMALMHECIRRGRQVHNDAMIGTGYTFLAVIYYITGEAARMLEAARSCIKAAERGGELFLALGGYATQATAQSRLGQHELAMASMAQEQRIAQQLGGEPAVAELFMAMRAEIALNAGRYSEATRMAQETFTYAQAKEKLWGMGIAQRVWAQALASSDPSQFDQADEHFTESLRCFEQGEARLETSRTRVAWGNVLRERGELERAREHFEQATLQFGASGLTLQLEETRALLRAIP